MTEQEPSQVPPQQPTATEPPPPPTQPAWAPSGPSGPRASFGRRFVAVIVDSVILAVVYGIFYAIGDVALAYIGSLLIGLAYFVFFEGGSRGQTPGKMALGIRVVDFSTGGPIGYGRGALRYIGRLVSQLVCFLGYLWMLWDREKQTWHDKFANSVVVPVQYYPVSS